MFRTSSWKRATWLIPLCCAAGAQAQEPAPNSSVEAAQAVPEAPSAAPAADGGSGTSSAGPEFMPGFEAGLRIGIGLPLGNAGDSPTGTARSLGDLVTWRMPVWVDVAYRVSRVSSYGLYGQLGTGGAGDQCSAADGSSGGECHWTDLRLGAQGQWHLNPGGDTDPWLGLGVGLEALNVQVTQSLVDEDGQGFTDVTKESLIGPELLLQAGLSLQVDKWVQLGPYAAASIGSYVGDSYDCPLQAQPCPRGSSVNGSAFHAWLGVGISGRYLP